MRLRLVCSCLCVFEGEKRGSGEIACCFFLAGSSLLGHSSRNHKMTNFPASLSFFPLSICVAHVFPGILAPLDREGGTWAELHAYVTTLWERFVCRIKTFVWM